MTTIRQSYEAAKYHKKITIFFFVLFSIILLALSFVSQLLSTQAKTLEYITNKINDVKKIFPQMNQTLSENLIESNQSVTAIYHTIYFSLIFCSFFIFLIFSLLSAKTRKNEIDSLHYMGIKKRRIVTHLLSDLLIPISLSCFLMFLFFLICQQQVFNESVAVNRKVAGNYIEEHRLIPEKDDSITDQSFTKTNTNTSKKAVTSENTDKTLIPFNQLSPFEIDLDQQSATTVFLLLVKNSMLLGVTSLIGCFVGFYSYTTICFRRRSIA